MKGVQVYLYAFNGKENDKDFGNQQLVQDYGFRIYNPAIGKFLSVDPLTKSYPELTPYQFASNKPINGVDLDGLEWVLKIYGSYYSKEYTNARNAKDVYRIRQLTNQGLYDNFGDAFLESHLLQNDLPQGSPAMTLTYDPRYIDIQGGRRGLTVITQTMMTDGKNTVYGDNDIKGNFFPEATGGLFPDMNYPLDIRSHPEYIKQTGEDFYGDDDFVGYATEVSLVPIGGKVGGWMNGYMKGWGFVQYSYLNDAIGVDAGIFYGEVRGKYVGDKGYPTPRNFAGRGHIYFDGSYGSLGGNVWVGEDDNGNILWRGTTKGFSGGALKGGGSVQNTETKLRFPYPGSETRPDTRNPNPKN